MTGILTLAMLTMAIAEAGRRDDVVDAPKDLMDVLGPEWNVVPLRSSAYHAGDVYDLATHTKLAPRSDCFAAEPDEDVVTSLDIVKAMKAHANVRLGIVRLKGGGVEFKRRTYAAPYLEEFPRIRQAPLDGCVSWLKTQDLSQTVLVEAVLSAEVKEEQCTEVEAGASAAGFGVDASVGQTCKEESEGHVAVAYKYRHIHDVIGLPPVAAPPPTLATPAPTVTAPPAPSPTGSVWHATAPLTLPEKSPMPAEAAAVGAKASQHRTCTSDDHRDAHAACLSIAALLDRATTTEAAAWALSYRKRGCTRDTWGKARWDKRVPAATRDACVAVAEAAFAAGDLDAASAYVDEALRNNPGSWTPSTSGPVADSVALVEDGWWASWERASGVTSTAAQKAAATRALTMLCANGSAYACAGQGLLVDDLPAACTLFRTACAGESAVGCKNLAACHNLGVAGFPKSSDLAQEACDRASEFNWHYYEEAPPGNPEWFNNPGCYSYNTVRCYGTTFTDDFEDLDSIRCGGNNLGPGVFELEFAPTPTIELAPPPIFTVE